MDEMNETMSATVVANEETTIPMEAVNNKVSTIAVLSAASIAACGGLAIGVAFSCIPKAVRWAKNKIEKRKLAVLEDEVENDL